MFRFSLKGAITIFQLTHRSFRFTAMSKEQARMVCSWYYAPPYDRYNWEPWEVLQREDREIANASIRSSQFRSAWLGNELSGFVQCFPLASDRPQGTIRLGLGLRPELCGRGLGAAFAAAAARDSAKRYPGAEIDAEVAADNVRAAKAYRKAGFSVTEQYTTSVQGRMIEVLCMVWSGE